MVCGRAYYNHIIGVATGISLLTCCHNLWGGLVIRAEPHYGWADAVGNSVQLLAIEALERPPGIYPDLDLGMNE